MKNNHSILSLSILISSFISTYQSKLKKKHKELLILNLMCK